MGERLKNTQTVGKRATAYLHRVTGSWEGSYGTWAKSQDNSCRFEVAALSNHCVSHPYVNGLHLKLWENLCVVQTFRDLHISRMCGGGGAMPLRQMQDDG